MNFGQALEAIKDWDKVRRAGWYGKGMWIALWSPPPYEKMQQPYIYMSPADGKLIPWLASQADLLAEDWEIAP